MPRRDGTGPMGMGPVTGIGLGVYTRANTVKYGAGFGPGFRQGFGRGLRRYFVVDQTDSKLQKELLQEQKDLLKSRLDVIDKQLENL